jgi:predicted secreted protein
MTGQWLRLPSTCRLALFCAAFLLLSASASRADMTIVTSPDSDRNATMLHLTYRAERLVARDLAHVELRFEVVGNDPAELEAEVNRRISAGAETAAKLAGTTVTVGPFAVVRQPATSYARTIPGGGMRPGADPNMAVIAEGEWRVSQLLTLVGRDMRGLAELTTQLQKDGAGILDMHFEVAPETLGTVRQELGSEGLAKLRAEAQQVATDMGLQVERYRNLEISPANPEAMPARYFGVQQAVAAAAFPLLQAGEMTVSVTVTANVSLIPKSNP